jgi:hypothetical protein
VNKLKASACLTIRAPTGNQEVGIGSRGLEHSRKHARLGLGRASIGERSWLPGVRTRAIRGGASLLGVCIMPGRLIVGTPRDGAHASSFLRARSEPAATATAQPSTPLPLPIATGDFPLTFNHAPELETRFLLDIGELNAHVFRANTRDGAAEKLVIAFQEGIKSVFFFLRPKLAFHQASW